jgi:hypothetical protein
MGSERAYHKARLPVAEATTPGDSQTAITDLYKGRISEVAQLRAIQEELRNKLDSLSELGETESLRLQMAMDRVSKMMSTLSNLRKKMSDAACTITQNFK